MSVPFQACWFRFRTLFVLVAFLSIPLAWVAYSLNWIKERRAALILDSDVFATDSLSAAPGALWIFGETGHVVVHCRLITEIERYKRLFPEARIVPLDFNDSGAPLF